MKSTCPDPQDLERLAMGQLPEAEAAQLAQHVLSCSNCAQLVNALPTTDSLLMDLRAVAESMPVGPGADLLVERPVRVSPIAADSAVLPTTLSVAAGGVEAPEPPSQRVGRYQIVRRLGAGGMGVVYRAYDPQLGRDVAIKLPTFHGPDENHSAARQRFLREARAAAAVRHAHVCPIYDVGEEQGRPYVVMAFVEGETLGARLRRQGRYEEPRVAVSLLLRVADALVAVHAAQVIHRDLKPGNILLDRAGQPYVTDFGLARAGDNEHLTAVGQVLGTPAYMAPEQAVPEFGSVGPWSDQYSLGVVLYEMLTGRLPFEGSVSSVLYQLGARAAPPPSLFRPDLDPRLEAICLKTLEKKPDARFRSIPEFANALESYLQPAGTPAPATQSAPRREPSSANVERQPGLGSAGEETSRLCLAARYYLEKRTEAGLRKGIATYYQALDADPAFAPAWAGLAAAYHRLSVWGHVSPHSACPKAKSAALRAIELDGSLGEAHTTLAAILMEYEWDLTKAEQTFRHALALTPDHAYAHQWHGKCLACMGRHADAIAALRCAEKLEPLSRTITVSLARHGFILARMYDEAVQQLRKTLQTDPNFWLAHRFLGWAYLFHGDPTAALAEFETARCLDDNAATVSDLGHAYAAAGQPAKAREMLDDLAQRARQGYISPDRLAIVHISLGDKDEAFVWLRKAVEDRSEWLCKIRVDPILDPLRSDPRFPELLRLTK